MLFLEAPHQPVSLPIKGDLLVKESILFFYHGESENTEVHGEKFTLCISVLSVTPWLFFFKIYFTTFHHAALSSYESAHSFQSESLQVKRREKRLQRSILRIGDLLYRPQHCPPLIFRKLRNLKGTFLHTCSVSPLATGFFN